MPAVRDLRSRFFPIRPRGMCKEVNTPWHYGKNAMFVAFRLQVQYVPTYLRVRLKKKFE